MHPIYPVILVGGALAGNYLASKLRYEIMADQTSPKEKSAKAKAVSVATRFCNFTLFHSALSSLIGGSASFACIATLSDGGDKVFAGNWTFVSKAIVFTASAAVVPAIIAASSAAGFGAVGGIAVGLTAVYLYNLARFKMYKPADTKTSQLLCDALFSTFCTTTVLGAYIPVINLIPVPIKATIDGAAFHFIKPILFDELLCKNVVEPLCNAAASCYEAITPRLAPITEIAGGVDKFFSDVAVFLKDKIPDVQVGLV